MAEGWTKCSLTIFSPTTRRRRNAVVAPMMPGAPTNSPERASRASSASWETISGGANTPAATREPTPMEVPQSPGGGAYPTPACSGIGPQDFPQIRRDVVLESPTSRPNTPFTAESESPPEQPVNFLHKAHNLLLNTDSSPPVFETPHRNGTTPLPPLSAAPEPPMAPRTRRQRHVASPATTHVTETPVIGPDEAANAIPSIETDDGDAHGHNHQQQEELDRLRASRNDLTNQLENSTALVERLRVRVAIADTERDGIVAQRDAVRAELETVQGERDIARTSRFALSVKYRALLGIVALYGLYRWFFYRTEFEYIDWRTKEVLELGA